MRRIKSYALLILFPALLGGCHSVPGTAKDINDEGPIYDATTDRNIADMEACITSASGFKAISDHAKIKSSPDSPKIEIAIGGMEKDKYKDYYLIELSPHYGVTEVSVKRSSTDFKALKETDLQAIVSDCAGGRRD
jgi:hypothetical protein